MYSFIFLALVRKFLRDILLRVRKCIILISVGVRDTNSSILMTLAPNVFLNCFFDKERTLLKDKGQKGEKSNFSVLEEKAEVFGISGNLLSGESDSPDQKERQ